MHSDPAAFQVSRAASLHAVLEQLAAEPGLYTALAGGTELMVAFNTGRLASRRLISIQHLPELRFLRSEDDQIHIGAASTFTDLRRSPLVAEHLPLLAQAASWTGSIANQNRATIGGNLCNASPAADTPPVLLAYDAAVVLTSAGGQRTLPYREFHLGYKRTALRPDELLHSIVLRCGFPGHRQYIRKVGTRSAQAISKTAIAGVATLLDDSIAQIRLGAASLGDRPMRLYATEAALLGARLTAPALEGAIRTARSKLAAETHPIDDIRSTARYRSTVAANLVEEFVRQLASEVF